MVLGGIVIQVRARDLRPRAARCSACPRTWALLLFALAFRAAKQVYVVEAAVAAPEDAVAR